MKPSQVVVKFLNARLQKGLIENFEPQTGRVILDSPQDRTEVVLADLKAIFFLREANTFPVKEEAPKPGLVGDTYALKLQEEGFFLFPITKTDNNERIYVIRKNVIRVI